jgi:Holliday junction resolvase YEN1
MITKHFSSMTLNSPNRSHNDNNGDERLIVKIHATRNHVSTDGILEYRLEIAPAQLVRIAESGIKGIRRPEDVDEWADEDDEDDGGGDGKRGSKKVLDPESHLRVWMPASLVKIAEPGLVEEYEQIQCRKRAKKTGNSRAKVKQIAKLPQLSLNDDSDGDGLPPAQSQPVFRPSSRNRLSRKDSHSASPQSHSASRQSPPLPKPFPISLNDMFEDSDILHNAPKAVSRSKQARPGSAISSNSDSPQTRLKKSPRKSAYQTSPRPTRIAPKHNSRPGSPSPLPSRTTKPKKLPSRSKRQLGVIEISSDSDAAPTKLMGLPLLLAREKARSKAEPTLSQASRKEHVQPRPRKPSLKKIDINAMHSDIIDLT